VWNDDIDISDIVPSERKSKKQKKKEERRKAKARAEAAETNEAAVDEDAMDADAVQPQQSYLDDDEEWDGTEEMRKRKLAEYMDEVYGLEFNDVVRLMIHPYPLPTTTRMINVVVALDWRGSRHEVQIYPGGGIVVPPDACGNPSREKAKNDGMGARSNGSKRSRRSSRLDHGVVHGRLVAMRAEIKMRGRRRKREKGRRNENGRRCLLDLLHQGRTPRSPVLQRSASWRIMGKRVGLVRRSGGGKAHQVNLPS